MLTLIFLQTVRKEGFTVKNFYSILCFIGIINIQCAFGNNQPPVEEAQHAVSVEMFSLFMAVQNELPAERVKAHWQDFQDFAEKLSVKKSRYKSDKAFVEHMFYKMHRKLLKKYSKYTNLFDLFEEGVYNCATGTAVYALLLDAFAIDYKIHETPYHVFLMVYTNNHTDSVLIESTDPHGFIDSKKEMAAVLDAYRKPVDSAEINTFDTIAIQDHINLRQLAGLNYFNQAINHYNHRQFNKAMQYLDQASNLYPAERMNVFRAIIYQAAQRISMLPAKP